MCLPVAKASSWLDPSSPSLPAFRALLALAILLAPGLLVHADAQGTPGFSVIALRRVGDDVTLELRANFDVRNVIVRLDSAGSILGTPDWERATWASGERATGTFHLLRDADSGRLVITYQTATGVTREQVESIFIPDPPSSGAGAARLLVTRATLAARAVSIELANVGDVEARPVVVSIEDTQQRKIATPYSRALDVLAAGATTRVPFDLLEDARDVVIALEYSGRTERTRVTLTATATTDDGTGDANVTLSTDLPFREVDVGRSADYAVSVRNLGRPALVQLAVAGLPSGYSARFFVGGSAVPSLYVDRNQTRQVTLTVTVPNSNAEVDRTVDFSLGASVNGTNAGRLAMGLAVRGVGKLEIDAEEPQAQLPQGGEAAFRVEVRNAGSAPLFNVELESRRPYGWTIRTEPRVLDRLDPGQSASFVVQARAPDVLAGGRYSLDVAAKTGDVASRFETLSMEVQEPASSGGWLWIVFLVIIAAILGFGAWWKWRA